MPKRPNPFGDASPLQLKTHVGTREMNMFGVNGDQNMKAVYEKTKNLLFTGAQKYVFDEDIDHDANQNVSYVPNYNTRKQMTLDSKGKIVAPCGESVELPAPVQDNDDDMDVDSAACPNASSNRKISEFFVVKSQRQTEGEELIKDLS